MVLAVAVVHALVATGASLGVVVMSTCPVDFDAFIAARRWIRRGVTLSMGVVLIWFALQYPPHLHVLGLPALAWWTAGLSRAT